MLAESAGRAVGGRRRHFSTVYNKPEQRMSEALCCLREGAGGSLGEKGLEE